MGKLSPLESTDSRPRRIIAFDTEDDSNGHVGIINFAYRNRGSTITHKTFRHPVLARQWIRKQKGNIIFVAHNLEYDLCNVYRDQNFVDVDRLSYTARLIVAELNNNDIRWLDSFNFFPQSLAKMGDVIGLPKMESDFQSVEYCRRDTEIVLVFMEMFQKKLLEDVGVGISATIGGIAMKAFRTKFLKTEVATWNEVQALNAYYGGRCELFYKGQLDDVKVADVNSMYPSVMKKPYPDCSSIEEGEEWNDFEYGIAHVKIHVPESEYVAPLPHKDHDGRLVFPVGTFSGWWTVHEIRHAIQTRGAKVLHTYECWGTNMCQTYFTDYVDWCYNLRLSADDEFTKMFYKLLGNNLYGRFSQHNPRVEARTCEMDEEELEKTQARLIKTLGVFWIYEIPLIEPPPTANWLWGTYVTSYARIELDKALFAAHKEGNQIIYCDTDSIFWTGKDTISGVELDNKKLGAWKIEKFQHGNFIMPKGYILKGYPVPVTEKLIKKWPTLKMGEMFTETKIACKGVPMPRSLDYEDLETEENPAYKFLMIGNASTKKPVRLRTALDRGLVPGAWMDVKKTRISEYKRRVVNQDGTTKPIILDDEEGAEWVEY